MQLGDWLDPNAPGDDPTKAMTDPALVATAYFAHSARRMAAIAAVLGEGDDARRYAALAGEVKAAFAGRYMSAPGRMSDDTQTAYALATAFDLWPDDAARQAGTHRLAELVRAAKGRIATGFAGTPVVSDALSASGHLDEAYELLECTDPPSWLYAVVMGGTTIWERWDSLRPDGTVYPGDMTSFNHYALGAVADWLHRVVAGIEAMEPGWRRIRFAPQPGGSLTSAAARHLTPYGVASIRWVLDADRLRVHVRVPVGAGADGRAAGAANGRDQPRRARVRRRAAAATMIERDFPPDFLWGSATSAHQVEGGNTNSDWWRFEHSPSGARESSGDAIDHLRRYREDFELLAGLGHTAHRLSVEWARIEPAEGEFSRPALDHYRRVLAELRGTGMTSFVTLHHFTLPAWFADRGGWLARDAIPTFERYCRRVVATIGDLA